MESKEDFQQFPWSSNHEFESVANIILNLDLNSNLLFNIDFLKDLQWTERQLTIWQTKTSSSQHLFEIDATHSIVNCILHEYLPKLDQLDKSKANQFNKRDLNNEMNCKTTQLSNNLTTNNPSEISSILSFSSFNLMNEEAMSCLYSNSILKFFKMLSYYDVSYCTNLFLFINFK